MGVKTCLLGGAALAVALVSPLLAQTPAPTAPPAAEAVASTPATPAEPRDSTGHHVVRNADVIAMVQSQLSDDTVLGMIALNETHFDVSADGLLALKKAGVSDRVINAILESARRQQSPAASPAVASSGAEASSRAGAGEPGASQSGAAPASAQAAMAMPGMAGMDPRTAAAMQSALARAQSMGYAGPGGFAGPGIGGAAAGGMPRVFLVVESVRTELSASMAQRAVSNVKSGAPSGGAMALSSLASQALSFATIGAGPAGMAANMAARSGFSMLHSFMPGTHPSAPKITYAWGLPGAHSGRALPATQPTFELLYKDIPGIDPDAFEPALVRLALTRDNYRLVGATRQEMGMGMSMGAGATPDWVTEDRMSVRLQKLERGSYTLLIEKPLEAGEYAVVLRPAKHYKAQPSGFGSADQLTASVWDFSLPGATSVASAQKR